MKALIVADICWGDRGFGCFLIGLIWGFIGSLWAGGSFGVVSCCVDGDEVGAGVDEVVVVVVCSSFSFCFCCFSFLSIDLVLIVVVAMIATYLWL